MTRFTCRGVSPVISALLLAGLAVTASVLFYVYSTGVVYPLMAPTPNHGIDQPSIEMIAFSNDGSAQLTVRNIGVGDLSVVSIYVDGNLGYSAPQGIRIPIGQTGTFDISNVFAPGTVPAQHTFKVVTLHGGMASTFGPDYFVYGAYTVTYGTTYTTTSASSGFMTTTATTTTTSYGISTNSRATITTTTSHCGGTFTTTTITTVTTTVSSVTSTQTSTIASTGIATATSTGTTTVTTNTT